jgi:hypothetical protein
MRFALRAMRGFENGQLFMDETFILYRCIKIPIPYGDHEAPILSIFLTIRQYFCPMIHC